MNEFQDGVGPFIAHISLQSLQVDPGSGGLTYDLKDKGNHVAYLIATANVSLNGIAPHRLWFSTDVTGKDFELTVTSATPSTSGGLTYKAVDFSAVTSLPSYSSGWVIKRSGTEIGYSYYNGTTLNYVRIGANTDFEAGDSFQWTTSLSIPTSSSYYLAGCPEV